MDRSEVTMPDEASRFPKQAVGVFASPEALEVAIDRLEEAQFDHERISVVAMRHVLQDKLKRVHSTMDLADAHFKIETAVPVRHVEMNELRAAAVGLPAYLGAVGMGAAAVSGGVALPIVVATIAGGAGGALLGGIFTAWLNQLRADYYGEQVAHGGILLWATLDNEEDEQKIREFLPELRIEPVKILDSAPNRS
jgi:hypothetical protein